VITWRKLLKVTKKLFHFFVEKNNHQVITLVKEPNVFIYNECIGLCVDTCR